MYGVSHPPSALVSVLLSKHLLKTFGLCQLLWQTLTVQTILVFFEFTTINANYEMLNDSVDRSCDEYKQASNFRTDQVHQNTENKVDMIPDIR